MSVVDGSRIRQRGMAGEFKRQPGRARSETPSHLHSDSPKSQHSPPMGRVLAPTDISASTLWARGPSHSRSFSQSTAPCFAVIAECWGESSRVRGRNMCFIDLYGHAETRPNRTARQEHPQQCARYGIDTGGQIQASGSWPVGRAGREIRATPALNRWTDYAP